MKRVIAIAFISTAVVLTASTIFIKNEYQPITSYAEEKNTTACAASSANSSADDADSANGYVIDNENRAGAVNSDDNQMSAADFSNFSKILDRLTIETGENTK